MVKKIIKEIIIVLLLSLAIILILGVLLYDYVPMSKIVPEPVSYSTSEEVKQELLKSTDVDQDQIIMTYEIDGTDLNNYKKIQDYKPGKPNPFSTYKITENNTTNNNATSGNTTVSNSNNNTTSSGGNYFKDEGTK